MNHQRSRYLAVVAFCMGCIGLMSTAGRAQTLIPVPMTSVFAGEPAATYNGATSAGSICTSSGGLLTAASGYTWSNTYGDGCVPTQAHLGYPMGLTKDSSGNFYTADNYDGEVRVLYQSGTALAAAIVAGNPQAATFTPTAGHIYGFGRQTTAITASSGVYYCGGSASNGTALDAYGDGCPAYYGVYAPRNVFVDANGNIFFISGPEPSTVLPSVRVIYVGGGTGAGTAGAYIKAYNGGITPQPGYVYALSTIATAAASSDFEGSSGQGAADIVIDSNENIYVSDNTASITTVTGLGATTSGGQIKKFSTTAVGGTSPGWLTYVAGSTTSGVSGTAGTPDSANGDGGPVSGAVSDQPTAMYMDASNNLYFASGQDRRIRMVYAGGTPAAPPYVVGSTTNVVVTPTAGDVYTVAGGVISQGNPGSQTFTNLLNSVNGVTSTGTLGATPSSGKVQLQYIEGMGQDNSGNLIVAVDNYSGSPTNAVFLLNINQSTGGLTIFGGQSTNGGTGTTWLSTTTPPVAGALCQSSASGGTLYGENGPVMTDAYGDGCPATMASVLPTTSSRLMTDSAGNLYELDGISSSSTGSIIREYNFAQSIGSVTVGTSATTSIAYAFGKTNYTTAPTIVLGNSAFTDNTANDSCFTSTSANSLAAQSCVYSITFSPTVAGSQSASVTASSGSTSLGTGTITGSGNSNLTPAATPTFSPVAGTYTSVQTVTISDTTTGATIYYTTDGSTPTASSTAYTGTITVSATETLQATAVASGYNNSAVASAAYTINLPTAATPTFSPVAGTYTASQTVTISDTTTGAAIYYTTNGTTPTTSSAKYTAAITVGTTETVEALAVASGYNNSAVASAAYTINQSVAATPTFSPAAGTYTASQTVTISDTTSGAAIYYTTDGTTPTTSSTKYTSTITVGATQTLQAIAVASSYNNSVVASAVYTINLPTAATPTFSPAAGTYTTVQSVAISDTTTGAAIYYTTNGTTPTTASTLYTGAISISASETIEAIAVASGYNNSSVGSAIYTINLAPAATPTFSPAAGTYTSAQTVTISDTTTGATIYYTTNGSTPTTSSTLYAGAISVSTTETVQAIAVASGYNTSAAASAVYTINQPAAATPTFSPVPGTYTATQTVTITDTTTGAAIYYTTNGTTPTASATLYTSAVSVSATETIEAIAIASGYNNSAVASGTYTINLPTAATPAFLPAAGTYTSSQTVTISDATTGAAIYYTTNGTTPTTSSTLYTGALTVTTSETIEAIAVASGYNTSSVGAAAYIITLPSVATPTFSPVAGSYTSAQTVTLSDATAGAAIYYTTNGTTPTTTSTLYAGAITVNSTETIEAIAVASGYANSAVGTAVFTITPSFSLSIASPAITVLAGLKGTVPVVVTPTGGFSSAITFTCSGLSAIDTCSFSPATVTPSGSAVTETVTVTVPLQVAAVHHNKPLTYVPQFAAMLFILCGSWKMRRRVRGLVMFSAIALCGLMMLTGCGVSAPTVAADTSQTTTVTVTGTAGTLTSSATFTLTVP